ncbi:MAG TPA: carbamoyltransferase C-terminal domain-containing protein [Opitutaceae bacterium]|jgi:carbamoyltransferase|nr:carbamoyltransferase C-terminal domain-containing protein [Opitutaceae bacterium]
MSPSYDAVIGVWDGHDAGAALVIEGKVALALNEERLSGRKLDVGLPRRALAAMRQAAEGRRLAWAITTSDPAKALTRQFPWMKENYYQLRRRLVPPGPLHGLTLRTKYFLTQRPTNSLLRRWARHALAADLKVSSRDVFLVDHHAAHAASAAFWPKWGEDALIVTLDGIGDGESGSVWRWTEANGELTPLISIPGSASLGLFFEHVTNELQMRPLEDEGKVMALATYAADVPLEKNLFLKWFSLKPDHRGLPVLRCSIPPSRMAREVARVIWCTPRESVCRMAQQTLEQIVPRFFSLLVEATGCGAFGYAGGVASNIKVNRLIRTTPGVTRLEVCPAMGDGGLALGAALATWKKVTGQRPVPFSDFRLGLDHGDLGRDAKRIAREASATLTQPMDIAQAVAERVAAGEIVMWAQGRMELGARALGARSIVARADNIAARDDLNLRLKRRVWYQPFCPAILLSEAPELLADFRGPRDINRHMTGGFLTTPQGRAALAGATGPDGSCRPQMVEPDEADPWYRLLTRVKALTGTGAIINTSLNMHGKPMSDDGAGVVEAWLESGVQHLALGSALLTKCDTANHKAQT